ncbi:MAG: redox-regulated ATPase YchF [Aigarchaeota archaeon]|nr:redox-regulated ATPase YchF [Aigarchaeota archaeon]MCX8192508.1 redox-regulated ATPase YchF [Nitrososphaeria archaeon]MDW7985756.1 redox-regulated ATPase YchF [Nitrososphaerota archaeon]
MELAGIVGKANVGKSTLFSAMTLAPVEIANYPFTTIKPNRGVTYLRIDCVCKELGVKDNPKNSRCIDGSRFIPIEIIDCPGIIRGAHKGRGLGLQFLDEIRQASALIVVVDAAGATDSDGNPVEPGTGDPLDDVKLVEEEFTHWVVDIISSDWQRICRIVENKFGELEEELEKKLSGLGIGLDSIREVIRELGLNPYKPTQWSREQLYTFTSMLVKKEKPIIVAANKIDIREADKGVEKIIRAGYETVPVSAEAERILRLASEKGLVKYLPGEKSFEIIDEPRLTRAQKNVLEKIYEMVFKRWGSTGVQELINNAYFKLLKYIPVYPVEDSEKLTDHDGNVLPDVYIVPQGSKPRDLAYKIHSELGKTFLYAIDAKKKIRVSDEYTLKWGDVISIVSTAKRG